MSQFYDLASLVVIPSGYKASTIYAQKPLTTDGQLSFTRASGATRVGPNGLIEEVRTNLALYSEQFNDAYWTKTDITVTANTTANPVNGATTADTLTRTGAAVGFTNRQIAQTGIVTFSVYAKAGTTNEVRLNTFDGSADRGATYNLTTGAITGPYGSPLFTTSQALSNGWYRISITVNSATYTRCQIHLDTINSVIVFGAQLETGDIATNYIPTTTAAVSVGPVSNVPRLDYLGSSCPRLLLEPQRTNLVVQSNFLNLWSRFQNTTKSFDSAVLDPAGNPSSRYLRNSASTALASRDGVSILANTTYTFTYYARKGNYSAQLVEVGFGSNNVRVTYNFDTNTFSSSTAGSQTLLSTSAQSVGNGWVRIALTFTGSITTVNCAFLIGDALNNFVYIYGAQLEAGAYATSYIPTLGASVTRVADAASKTGISSLIGQSAGTIFWDITDLTGTATGSGNPDFGIRNAAFTNWIGITTNTFASPFRVTVRPTTGSIIDYTANLTRVKAAVAWSTAGAVLYVNGAQVATSAVNPNFSFDRINMLGDIISYKTNQALLFTTRLTNAQLSELTTL